MVSYSVEKLLCIDVEATCWENKKAPIGQTKDIIEIGIALIDTRTLQVEINKSFIVKPERSKISKYCNDLTSLTQNEVDSGISFKKACEEIREFNPKAIPWLSWGNEDRRLFEQQCRETSVEYPFGPRHIDFKSHFAILHGLFKEVSLKEALEIGNVTPIGKTHSGKYDALNTAYLYINAIKRFRGQ